MSPVISKGGFGRSLNKKAVMSDKGIYRSFSLMTILFDDLHLGQDWYRGTFLAISDCFSVHECLQSWQ